MWGQSYIPNGRGRGNITGRGGSGRRNNTNMHVTMNMSSGRGGAGGGGMNNNNNANSMNMNLNNTLNSNMSMNNMTMPAFQSISSSSNQNYNNSGIGNNSFGSGSIRGGRGRSGRGRGGRSNHMTNSNNNSNNNNSLQTYPGMSFGSNNNNYNSQNQYINSSIPSNNYNNNYNNNNSNINSNYQNDGQWDTRGRGRGRGRANNRNTSQSQQTNNNLPYSQNNNYNQSQLNSNASVFSPTFGMNSTSMTTNMNPHSKSASKGRRDSRGSGQQQQQQQQHKYDSFAGNNYDKNNSDTSVTGSYGFGGVNSNFSPSSNYNHFNNHGSSGIPPFHPQPSWNPNQPQSPQQHQQQDGRSKGKSNRNRGFGREQMDPVVVGMDTDMNAGTSHMRNTSNSKKGRNKPRGGVRGGEDMSMDVSGVAENDLGVDHVPPQMKSNRKQSHTFSTRVSKQMDEDGKLHMQIQSKDRGKKQTKKKIINQTNDDHFPPVVSISEDGNTADRGRKGRKKGRKKGMLSDDQDYDHHNPRSIKGEDSKHPRNVKHSKNKSILSRISERIEDDEEEDDEDGPEIDEEDEEEEEEEEEDDDDLDDTSDADEIEPGKKSISSRLGLMDRARYLSDDDGDEEEDRDEDDEDQDEDDEDQREEDDEEDKDEDDEEEEEADDDGDDDDGDENEAADNGDNEEEDDVQFAPPPKSSIMSRLKNRLSSFKSPNDDNDIKTDVPISDTKVKSHAISQIETGVKDMKKFDKVTRDPRISIGLGHKEDMNYRQSSNQSLSESRSNKKERPSKFSITDKNQSSFSSTSPFFPTSKSIQSANTFDPDIVCIEIGDDDGKLSVGFLGTCTDLCSPAETEERIAATSEPSTQADGIPMTIHEAKPVLYPWGRVQYQLISRLVRSSADTDIQLEDNVRTPLTLLRTIEYIEDHIMYYEDENGYTTPKSLQRYQFIYNRYRQIAKEFTLQQYRDGMNNDRICIECYERMVRWHIYMEHYMLRSKEYIAQAQQQNGQELNNYLKNLYKDCYLGRANGILSPNAPEMLAYYIMFQMDNGYEALLILQRIPAALLQTPELQFTLKLIRARRSNNYKDFFKLLKRATLLQACVMHRYVRDMRMMGLKVLSKSLSPGGKKGYMSLEDLMDIFMFETSEGAIDFLTAVGMELEDNVSNNTNNNGFRVVFNGADPYMNMKMDPTTDFKLPILPHNNRLTLNIEAKNGVGDLAIIQRYGYQYSASMSQICRGRISHAVQFVPKTLAQSPCSGLQGLRNGVHVVQGSLTGRSVGLGLGVGEPYNGFNGGDNASAVINANLEHSLMNNIPPNASAIIGEVRDGSSSSNNEVVSTYRIAYLVAHGFVDLSHISNGKNLPSLSFVEDATTTEAVSSAKAKAKANLELSSPPNNGRSQDNVIISSNGSQNKRVSGNDFGRFDTNDKMHSVTTTTTSDHTAEKHSDVPTNLNRLGALRAGRDGDKSASAMKKANRKKERELKQQLLERKNVASDETKSSSKKSGLKSDNTEVSKLHGVFPSLPALSSTSTSTSVTASFSPASAIPPVPADLSSGSKNMFGSTESKASTSSMWSSDAKLDANRDADINSKTKIKSKTKRESKSNFGIVDTMSDRTTRGNQIGTASEINRNGFGSSTTTFGATNQSTFPSNISSKDSSSILSGKYEVAENVDQTSIPNFGTLGSTYIAPLPPQGTSFISSGFGTNKAMNVDECSSDVVNNRNQWNESTPTSANIPHEVRSRTSPGVSSTTDIVGPKDQLVMNLSQAMSLPKSKSKKERGKTKNSRDFSGQILPPVLFDVDDDTDDEDIYGQEQDDIVTARKNEVIRECAHMVRLYSQKCELASRLDSWISVYRHATREGLVLRTKYWFLRWNQGVQVEKCRRDQLRSDLQIVDRDLNASTSMSVVPYQVIDEDETVDLLQRPDVIWTHSERQTRYSRSAYLAISTTYPLHFLAGLAQTSWIQYLSNHKYKLSVGINTSGAVYGTADAYITGQVAATSGLKSPNASFNTTVEATSEYDVDHVYLWSNKNLRVLDNNLQRSQTKILNEIFPVMLNTAHAPGATNPSELRLSIGVACGSTDVTNSSCLSGIWNASSTCPAAAFIKSILHCNHNHNDDGSPLQIESQSYYDDVFVTKHSFSFNSESRSQEHLPSRRTHVFVQDLKDRSVIDTNYQSTSLSASSGGDPSVLLLVLPLPLSISSSESNNDTSTDHGENFILNEEELEQSVDSLLRMIPLDLPNMNCANGGGENNCPKIPVAFVFSSDELPSSFNDGVGSSSGDDHSSDSNTDSNESPRELWSRLNRKHWAYPRALAVVSRVCEKFYLRAAELSTKTQPTLSTPGSVFNDIYSSPVPNSTPESSFTLHWELNVVGAFLFHCPIEQQLQRSDVDSSSDTHGNKNRYGVTIGVADYNTALHIHSEPYSTGVDIDANSNGSFAMNVDNNAFTGTHIDNAGNSRGNSSLVRPLSFNTDHVVAAHQMLQGVISCLCDSSNLPVHTHNITSHIDDSNVASLLKNFGEAVSIIVQNTMVPFCMHVHANINNNSKLVEDENQMIAHLFNQITRNVRSFVTSMKDTLERSSHAAKLQSNRNNQGLSIMLALIEMLSLPVFYSNLSSSTSNSGPSNINSACSYWVEQMHTKLVDDWKNLHTLIQKGDGTVNTLADITLDRKRLIAPAINDAILNETFLTSLMAGDDSDNVYDTRSTSSRPLQSLTSIFPSLNKVMNDDINFGNEENDTDKDNEMDTDAFIRLARCLKPISQYWGAVTSELIRLCKFSWATLATAVKIQSQTQVGENDGYVDHNIEGWYYGNVKCIISFDIIHTELVGIQYDFNLPRLFEYGHRNSNTNNSSNDTPMSNSTKVSEVESLDTKLIMELAAYYLRLGHQVVVRSAFYRSDQHYYLDRDGNEEFNLDISINTHPPYVFGADGCVHLLSTRGYSFNAAIKLCSKLLDSLPSSTSLIAIPRSPIPSFKKKNSGMIDTDGGGDGDRDANSDTDRFHKRKRIESSFSLATATSHSSSSSSYMSGVVNVGSNIHDDIAVSMNNPWLAQDHNRSIYRNNHCDGVDHDEDEDEDNQSFASFTSYESFHSQQSQSQLPINTNQIPFMLHTIKPVHNYHPYSGHIQRKQQKRRYDLTTSQDNENINNNYNHNHNHNQSQTEFNHDLDLDVDTDGEEADMEGLGLGLRVANKRVTSEVSNAANFEDYLQSLINN